MCVLPTTIVCGYDQPRVMRLDMTLANVLTPHQPRRRTGGFVGLLDIIIIILVVVPLSRPHLI